MGDLVGKPCVPAWFSADAPDRPHRTGEYKRTPGEWMPRPHAGRAIVSRNETDGTGIYLEVVPGPNRTWQLVRVELSTPVARGFATPERARAWVARAIVAGVLPKGVVVVEPKTSADAGEG